jgi:uncharacterized lipoprotein YddW (UPF0748 family)
MRCIVKLKKVNAGQIPLIADILQADPEELHTLWLVNQVTEVVTDEQKLADKALDVAKQNLKK